MRPLKILHVVKSLGRGGAERVVLDLARFGSAIGHDHSVLVAMNNPLDMAIDFEEQGVPLIKLGVSSLFGLVRLRRWLRSHVVRGQYDIVHGHFPLTSAIERHSLRRSDVPYLFTTHVSPSDLMWATKLANTRTWRYVSRNVSVSSQVDKDVMRQMGSSVPSSVILNGIDTERFARTKSRSSRKGELGMLPSDLVVGVVASMRPQKRLDRWVRVAAEVHRRNARVKFIVVGTGSEEHRMKQLSRELGLESHIDFVGMATDVRPWLEAMDVFLMTSDYEGFGLVAAEAMAMGVVPVVTSVGPLPEVVQSGWGMAVPTTVEALADATLGLLGDPERRMIMAHRGVEIARERYSAERMVREYHELYAEMIVAARKP